MSQIEVPDWVAVKAIKGFAESAGYTPILDDRNMRCMRAALTAALGAWVVEAGFTNSEEMRELLAGRGGWVSGIELDGDTHTLYTLRQEKPE